MKRQSIANGLMNGMDSLFTHVFFGEEYAIFGESRRFIILHKEEESVQKYIILSSIRQTATSVEYTIGSERVKSLHNNLIHLNNSVELLLKIVDTNNFLNAQDRDFKRRELVKQHCFDCYSTDILYSDFITAVVGLLDPNVFKEEYYLINNTFSMLLKSSLNSKWALFSAHEIAAVTADSVLQGLDDKFIAMHIPNMSDNVNNKILYKFLECVCDGLTTRLDTLKKKAFTIRNGNDWKPTLFYNKHSYIRSKKNKASIVNDITYYATAGMLDHELARRFLCIPNTKPFLHFWAIQRTNEASYKGLVKYSLDDIKAIISDHTSVYDLC